MSEKDVYATYQEAEERCKNYTIAKIKTEMPKVNLSDLEKLKIALLSRHKNELRIEICYKMDGRLTQTFIIVSEIRQAQKDKYCMIPLV